jgi:hypothetical protein
MRSNLSKSEIALMLIGLSLAALAGFGPALHEPAHYHAFADRRVIWQLPFAMDVLSNLSFALTGLIGSWRLLRSPARSLSNVQRAMSALLFAGLLLTAAGSGWYHWQPADASLVVDRCGMAVAFAGLLGLAAAGQVSERAGAATGLAVLVLGPFAAQTALNTGNVLPWALLQFGGMALVMGLALLPARRQALDIRWGLVIGGYAAAKLLEMNDHAIFHMTGQLVSGHTLKHLVAASAAWPVIAAIGALGASRQNRAGRRIHRVAGHRIGDV